MLIVARDNCQTTTPGVTDSQSFASWSNQNDLPFKVFSYWHQKAILWEDFKQFKPCWIFGFKISESESETGDVNDLFGERVSFMWCVINPAIVDDIQHDKTEEENNKPPL